jgi:PadR family transcriptional regulator, regulatory protein PadR
MAHGPIHGYGIMQSLEQMPTFTGHRPDATGVYRFLKAMEDRGLVSSNWDLAESGPAKRVFALLPAGRTCLARWVATLEVYLEQVGQLSQSLRHAVHLASSKANGHQRPKGGRRNVSPPVTRTGHAIAAGR